MANEIIVPAVTGLTLYAQARKGGQILNGSTPESYSAGHWSNYKIALAETNADGIYYGTFPVGAAAGKYTLPIFLQAGVAAAVGDLAADSRAFEWTGTVEASIGAGTALTVTANAAAGSDQVTVTITNTDTGNPIPDADVWITSDAEGGIPVAGTLQTDSSGEVLFLLDAGSTYFLWMQKDGENPISGQSFTAVADP